MDIVTHAVCLLGCEQIISEINEPCDKTTVAMVYERVTPYTEGKCYPPHRACNGHAWMHKRNPVMGVVWLVPMVGMMAQPTSTTPPEVHE